MTLQPIIDNVVAHCLDGEQKHPDKKTNEQWSEALSDRLATLLNCLSNTGIDNPYKLASKAAAQLAGLCIRLIEERGWPLIPTNSPENN